MIHPTNKKKISFYTSQAMHLETIFNMVGLTFGNVLSEDVEDA
jgi:hypothetical protein